MESNKFFIIVARKLFRRWPLGGPKQRQEDFLEVYFRE
jgi:hypothetical protein